MTSRPLSRIPSRNAMTQADFGSPTKTIGSGRSSPPQRQYIEIAGHEGRAANRAENMKYSKTTPNLSDYNDNTIKSDYHLPDVSNGTTNRRMSYSRHFDSMQKHRNGNGNGYNHAVAAENSSHSDPDSGGYTGSGTLRASNSLQLLPLTRDAHQSSSFRDKYNRPGSDWNLTTSKRAYR